MLVARTARGLDASSAPHRGKLLPWSGTEAPRFPVHTTGIKAELLDGGSFPGLAEAKFGISHHIAYYNAERRHSSFGYHSPNHFETQLQTTSQFRPA